jgi:hypothetical protein
MRPEVFDEQQQSYTSRSLVRRTGPCRRKPWTACREDSARGSGSARGLTGMGLEGEQWRLLEGGRFWEPQRERGPEEVSGAQLLERLVPTG